MWPSSSWCGLPQTGRLPFPLMRLWHLVDTYWWSATKWCIPKAAWSLLLFSFIVWVVYGKTKSYQQHFITFCIIDNETFYHCGICVKAVVTLDTITNIIRSAAFPCNRLWCYHRSCQWKFQMTKLIYHLESQQIFSMIQHLIFVPCKNNAFGHLLIKFKLHCGLVKTNVMVGNQFFVWQLEMIWR